MIEWIAEKLGYVHKDNVLSEVVRLIGDPKSYTIEKKLEEEFFADLARIDTAEQYLRATMANDMQRYFAAPQDQQEVVRGAFARTSFLLSRLRKTNEEPKEQSTKLEGLRYG